MDKLEYSVRVTALPDVDVDSMVYELLAELDSVEGIETVMVARTSSEVRDISEVVELLSGLSDDEVELVRDAIDSYTDNQ